MLIFCNSANVCYDFTMTSGALHRAIERLDQAVSSAERTIDSVLQSAQSDTNRRNSAVQQAMAEIDGLIAHLRHHDQQQESKDG
jgi:predicted transposase YbfD/YdcC